MEGKLGFITIEGEGKGRNPRIDDLHAAISNMAIENKSVSMPLMGSGDVFQRHSTDQCCGSYTTLISDTKISLYAAAIAERAGKAFEQP